MLQLSLSQNEGLVTLIEAATSQGWVVKDIDPNLPSYGEVDITVVDGYGAEIRLHGPTRRVEGYLRRFTRLPSTFDPMP